MAREHPGLPKRHHTLRLRLLASQSGVPACKALYTGSIPVSASPDSVTSGNICVDFVEPMAVWALYTGSDLPVSAFLASVISGNFPSGSARAAWRS
jgi:hypothetical protein